MALRARRADIVRTLRLILAIAVMGVQPCAPSPPCAAKQRDTRGIRARAEHGIGQGAIRSAWAGLLGAGPPGPCRLRGGANMPFRQGSTIEKEKQAASEVEAASLVRAASAASAGAAEESSGGASGSDDPASVNTNYASIIAKRKVKMSSIYDVDFGDAGVLGTGTFSTVREAIHKDTGMRYAVKAINLTNIQPQTLIRLRREIQVLRSLNHKNIIQLYEIFEEDGMLLMIMELCTGGELWHFLQVPPSKSPTASHVPRSLQEPHSLTRANAPCQRRAARKR